MEYINIKNVLRNVVCSGKIKIHACRVLHASWLVIFKRSQRGTFSFFCFAKLYDRNYTSTCLSERSVRTRSFYEHWSNPSSVRLWKGISGSVNNASLKHPAVRRNKWKDVRSREIRILLSLNERATFLHILLGSLSLGYYR